MISRVSMRELKPVWTSSSFLVYTGGLTVLLGGLLALRYLSHNYGSAAKVAWALLILVILYAIAHGLRGRDRPLAAGIFAFASVIAWAAFVILVFRWWGWNGVDAPESHWSWARTLAILLILAAAWDDRRRFRFPFIRAISAFLVFALVISVLPAGGSWTAAWALIVGFVYLLAGNVVDKPSAFWLHLAGGLLIGGAFLYWWHTSDAEWAGILIVAVLFVGLAHWTRRSSWAFLATIGFFAATIHYVVGSASAFGATLLSPVLGGGGNCNPSVPPTVCHQFGPSISPWAFPLAFGLLGFWLVLLGLLGKRRRAATTVVVEETVVVETPPPAAE
jgi:hypothetical protein